MKILSFAFLLFARLAFASDASTTLSAFSGRFELDPAKSTEDCKLNVHGPIEFVETHDETAVQFIYLGTNSSQGMRNIGRGRIKFDSCWSDGYIGFSETKLTKNKIEETTTYLKRGLFCSGGRVDHVRRYAWEIKGDQFVESNDGEVNCVFQKVMM